MNFDGQVAAIFVIILAAAEAAIGLAIVLNIYHRFQTVNVDEVSSLKE
jgi:NADH-quinone oxidoreductase subunit K